MLVGQPSKGKATGPDWSRLMHHFERTQVRYDDDPAPNEPAFHYRSGKRPVLISAPHGARHWREGRWKSQDGYTAALAHVLAEYTGAHALYTVRRIRPDPNFEDDSDYKWTLARLLRQHDIRLVLDLHGARPEREFGLVLGTIDGRTCPAYETVIIERFAAYRFGPDCPHVLDRLWINRLFKGGARQHTVTRFVWDQCRVNAAQLEINAHLRVIHPRPVSFSFTPDLVRLGRTMGALVSIILAV